MMMIRGHVDTCFNPLYHDDDDEQMMVKMIARDKVELKKMMRARMYEGWLAWQEREERRKEAKREMKRKRKLETQEREKMKKVRACWAGGHK